MGIHVVAAAAVVAVVDTQVGRFSHDFVCRQSLVGGHYALVDLARRQLSPDFWATLLFRRFVESVSW